MRTRITASLASDINYTIVRHLSGMEQRTENQNVWYSKDRNLSNERSHEKEPQRDNYALS